MKTQWMVIGVLALGVGAAAPWGVGYYTERQWQGVTTGFNDSQNVLRLETREYDRGYMNASVRGSMTFVAPDSGESHSFDYQARVSHGITGSLMDFSTTEQLGAGARRFFPDEKPRLTLETRLWGSATVEITVPEVKVTDEMTGETLTSARALGRADIGSAGSELEMLVEWPGMTLTGPDFNFELTDFRMDQTMEHLTGDLWLGGGEVTLASVQIDSPDQPDLRLDGLSMISDTSATADGQRLQGDSSIRLDSLAATGQTFGPHEIQVRFDGLDVTGLEEVSSAISDMQQAGMTSAVEPDPRAVMQQQMQAFQRVSGAMLGLAAEGFTLGFPKIDLSTPEGPINGELMISHPELSEDEKSRAMLVMQGLTGQFSISLPTGLLERSQGLAMQIAPLIKQGMVVKDGDRLRMSGSLKDMALDINGNILPLPPLF